MEVQSKEKIPSLSSFRHLSEEEKAKAQAFDKRKSELTDAFNKMFEDFGVKKPYILMSASIWEDGRFKTTIDYSSWLDSRK